MDTFQRAPPQRIACMTEYKRFAIWKLLVWNQHLQVALIEVMPGSYEVARCVCVCVCVVSVCGACACDEQFRKRKLIQNDRERDARWRNQEVRTA